MKNTKLYLKKKGRITDEDKRQNKNENKKQ